MKNYNYINYTKKKTKDVFITLINISIMGIFYIFTILNLSGIGQELKSNDKTIMLIGFTIVILNLRTFKKIPKNILISYYIIITAFTLSLLNIESNTEYIVKSVISISSVYAFSFVGKSELTVKLGSYLYSIITLYLLYDYKIGGITKGWNSNVIGMIGFLGIIYFGYSLQINKKKNIIEKIIKIIILITFLVLLLATNNRSSFIGVIITLIIFKFILKDNISLKRYRRINIFIYLIPVLVVLVVSLIYSTSIGIQLDALSKEFSDKTFMNGRETIWIDVLESMKGNIFFGHGFGYVGNTHNLFAHILYPFGIFGYIAYIIFFMAITYYMYNYLSDRIVRYSIAAFLAIFIQQSFEVLLFDIRTIVIINYLVLAIAIGRVTMLRKSKIISLEGGKNELFNN